MYHICIPTLANPVAYVTIAYPSVQYFASDQRFKMWCSVVSIFKHRAFIGSLEVIRGLTSKTPRLEVSVTHIPCFRHVVVFYMQNHHTGRLRQLTQTQFDQLCAAISDFKSRSCPYISRDTCAMPTPYCMMFR